MDDSLEKELLSDGSSQVPVDFAAGPFVAGPFVAGIDEAGRGPLAGPVVAAAVIYAPPLASLGVDDSKKLTPKKRSVLAGEIFHAAPAVGVGIVWPGEVDSLNIHNATLLAMKKSVLALSLVPAALLIDGIFTIKGLQMVQRAVKSGDSRCVSIAAASIIAKTTRDSIMEAYHTIYPAYNFKKNKGYGTKEHRAAIRGAGPCSIHRMSFSLTGGG